MPGNGAPRFEIPAHIGEVSYSRTALMSSNEMRRPSALYLFLLGWFNGLSEKFLAARTARLLVLAGTDRLDKTLMIGQMQGKFQMVVVPGVGHMLHEARIPNCRCALRHMLTIFLVPRITLNDFLR
ncbi:alpha/beta hydrolase family domain-containing protein [Rhizoctonia solani AG-1 IA]|uniref:Alpha/beta hydrolase family domain-containing protein n=1 Tax=Thanatephorus cucumeris (strain AG1-IA) TaxID=983506 RepID=L8WJZ2_THACA|nr:alpha/beta hydrolase family domain-containing protein [Rhizoctonia solani AG-1 IA]